MIDDMIACPDCGCACMECDQGGMCMNNPPCDECGCDVTGTVDSNNEDDYEDVHNTAPLFNFRNPVRDEFNADREYDHAMRKLEGKDG